MYYFTLVLYILNLVFCFAFVLKRWVSWNSLLLFHEKNIFLKKKIAHLCIMAAERIPDDCEFEHLSKDEWRVCYPNNTYNRFLLLPLVPNRTNGKIIKSETPLHLIGGIWPRVQGQKSPPPQKKKNQSKEAIIFRSIVDTSSFYMSAKTSLSARHLLAFLHWHEIYCFSERKALNGRTKAIIIFFLSRTPEGTVSASLLSILFLSTRSAADIGQFQSIFEMAELCCLVMENCLGGMERPVSD